MILAHAVKYMLGSTFCPLKEFPNFGQLLIEPETAVQDGATPNRERIVNGLNGCYNSRSRPSALTRIAILH